MKATKLNNAAQATANCGRNTRVETIVAIELAASCSPFSRSKTSAMATRKTTIAKPDDISTRFSLSHLRDDDVANLVGDVLETVNHFLEMIVNFRADHKGHRIGAAMREIERLDALVMQLV